MKSIFNLSCILLLNFLLINTLRTSAQNFKAVKTDASYYYYDSVSKEIIAARIDSTSVAGSENQYFGMRQIRQTDYGCYIPNGASWLGDLVTENPNGVFKFIVYPFSPSDSADIFTINSQALVGNYWHFYNYHSINDYVEAKVTQIIPVTFIGISDTVKTISLQRKSASGQNISDPINSQKILLSKNYGLIRLLKFDEFRTELKFFDLCGKTNPTIGQTNLTFDEIFDFQVGDEFHISYLHTPYVYFYPTNKGTVIQHIIEKIPGKSPNSVSYKIAECKNNLNSNGMGLYTYTNQSDTIIQTFNQSDYAELAYEPNQPYYQAFLNNSLSDNEMGASSKDFMNLTGIPWKYINAKGMLWNYNTPSCWTPATIDAYINQSYFYKGLGGPYYSWMGFNITFDYIKLVYFKKGSTTWGTPLSCDSLLQVGLPKYQTEKNLSIFPNPTSGIITIAVPYIFQLPCKLEVFDMAGRVAKEFQVTKLSQSFDLSNFPSGLYTYKVITANREVFRGKVIKQ